MILGMGSSQQKGIHFASQHGRGKMTNGFTYPFHQRMQLRFKALGPMASPAAICGCFASFAARQPRKIIVILG